MPYRQYSIGHVLYSEHYNISVNIISFIYYLCICLLCTVAGMHHIYLIGLALMAFFHYEL